MTRYSVISPLLLVRFQDTNGVFFHAWSLQRYGPVYTSDVIMGGENNPHPAMNREYTDMVRRILHEVVEVEEVVDMTTDFHCMVPVEERGDEAFVITFRDGPFSPVFFVREDAMRYLAYLREEWRGVERGGLDLHSFPHERI